MPPHEIVIDGTRFHDYVGFVEEFNRGALGLFGEPAWDGEDWDAFDDMVESLGSRLTIRWTHSEKSRSDLGYRQRAERLQNTVDEARSIGVYVLPELLEGIDDANAGRGWTEFDWLIDLLSHENVDFELE